MTETIDLLITFFEQERDYAIESANSGAHSGIVKKHLQTRSKWFDELVGTLKEAKTEEGVRLLKEAIEREKQRKKVSQVKNA